MHAETRHLRTTSCSWQNMTGIKRHVFIAKLQLRMTGIKRHVFIAKLQLRTRSASRLKPPSGPMQLPLMKAILASPPPTTSVFFPSTSQWCRRYSPRASSTGPAARIGGITIVEHQFLYRNLNWAPVHVTDFGFESVSMPSTLASRMVHRAKLKYDAYKSTKEGIERRS